MTPATPASGRRARRRSGHRSSRAALDTQSFLAAELTQLANRAGADYGFIGIVESDRSSSFVVIRDRFRSIRGAEVGAWQSRRSKFKVGGAKLAPEERSMSGFVAHTKQPRCAADVRAEQFYHAGNVGTESAVALPVVFRGDALAVLNLESRTPGRFNTQTVRQLMSWARRIAAPLHRRMLQDGLRKSRWSRKDERASDGALRLVRRMHGLMDRVNSSLAELRSGNDWFRMDTLEAEALDAAEVIGTDVLTLYAFDSDKREFEPPPGWPVLRGELDHPEEMKSRVYPDDVPWTIIRNGSQYWRDIQQVPELGGLVPERDGHPERERFAVRERIRSACGLRLEVGGVPNGVLFLNFRARQRFDAGHRELIETYAGHLSFVFELAKLYRRLRAAASKDEREYLDMELHDGALYGLGIATVACGAVREELKSRLYDKALDTLRILESGIVHASEEIADLRTSLQMPSLETTGLVAALRHEHSLVQWPVIDLRLPPEDPPISLDAKHAIRKVMQTAVRNIVEHAQASRAEITLSHDGTYVRFTVTDNGVGFNAAKALKRSDRHGLVDIQKRIAWLRGSVDIKSTPGAGTTITSSIPI